MGMQDFALMGTWSLTIIVDAIFEHFIFIIKFTTEAIFFKLNFYEMANYPNFFSIQGLYMFSMFSFGCLVCGLVFQVPWSLSILNCYLVASFVSNATFKTSINFQVQCFFFAFNFLFFLLHFFLLTLFSLNLLMHLLVLVIVTLLHYAMLLLHLLMHIIILLILTLVIMQATIINGSIPNSSISFPKIWCLIVLMGLVHGCYHSNLVSICSINDKCSLHSGLKSFNYPNPFCFAC